MAASNPTNSEPLNCDGLCRLMKIPDDQRELFIWWLIEIVEMRSRTHKAAPPRRRTSLNAKIAKSGRDYLRLLKQRDAPEDRRVIEAVSTHLQGLKVKQGAPTKRYDSFRTFLEVLLFNTCAMGGNRTTKKGNVVDLLNELRRVMPDGCIPRVLPISVIRDLSTKARILKSNPILGARVSSDLASLKVSLKESRQSGIPGGASLAAQ